VVSLGPDGIRDTADDLASWSLGRDVTELVRGKRWRAPAAVEPAPVVVKPAPTVATPAAASIRPAAPAPPIASARTTPPSLPSPKKPAPPAASKPKTTQIIDVDGDGIPDVR
jgi:hypothetical protein